MLRSLSALVLALSFAACGPVHVPDFPGPTPPPTPPPEPVPDKVCTPGAGDPGEHYGCWSQPPGQDWMYVCPVYDGAGNVVGTHPAPTPAQCESAPPPSQCLIPSGELTASNCGLDEGQFADDVKQATDALGDRSISRQASKEEKDARSVENLLALAAQLRQMGLCAYPGSEAVFILRDDGRWDEYHAVNFADAAWTNSGQGKYVGCHTGAGTVPPPPDNPPPPEEPPPDTGACGSPDPSGYSATFVLKKHNNNGLWDSTFKITDRTYCQQIPELASRLNCPVRPEGSPQRVPCERRAIGMQRWFCKGKPIEPTDNPAQAVCVGHVRTETQDGHAWAEADW